MTGPEDDASKAAGDARMIAQLYPEALNQMMATIDPNHDGVATSKEITLAMSQCIVEYLESNEGRKLNDAAKRDLSMDTLKHASATFRKALGTRLKVEDVTDADAKETTRQILERVNHGRERSV
jgi:predicted RNA-binding protein (virulence factor B family)